MVLTIGAIALFQAYWMRKNYIEEDRVLRWRSQLLFRETLFQLQNEKLHLDSAFDVSLPRVHLRRDAKTVSLVKSTLAHDTMGKIRQTVFITMSDPGRADSPLRIAGFTPSTRLVGILSNVDSLHDLVTVKEVHAKFEQVLKKENIEAPFTVTATPVDRTKDIFVSDSTDEQVIIGFSNPKSYRLKMGNTFWLTARRLGPQILFSLVLVGVTTFSFLLLYRNWRRQQKLIILKNDFISNITHELKTPIATVSVAVEALKNFNALQDPVRTQEYLDISAHELQRLSLLVDKVLKLSLFEKQAIELKKEDFDLKLLAEEVVASMRLQFEKYQAKVEMKSPEEVSFRLKADKLHFTSVIYNLLDNALKYSRLGPVLQVDLATEEDLLVLSVADNGIGIPAAYQARVFEKFFRVPTGDHHNVKGYGLGLSYVAYVVERQGGAILLDSKEGVGSRFTIKIPRGYA